MPILTPLVALAMLQGGWKTIQIGPGIKVQFPANGKRMPTSKAGETKLEAWSGKDREGNEITIGYLPYRKGSKEPFVVRAGLFIQGAFEGDLIFQQDETLSNGWMDIACAAVQPDRRLARSRLREVKTGMVFVLVQGDKPNGSLSRLADSIQLPAAMGKGTTKMAGPAWKRHPIPKTPFSFEFPQTPRYTPNPEALLPGVKTHEYSCQYLTQTFGITYIEVPDMDKVSAQRRDESLESLANSARMLDPKAKPAEKVSREGREVWQATALLGEKRLNSARIETFTIGNRMIRSMVIGPAPLDKSEAVERFFRSVKVDK